MKKKPHELSYRSNIIVFFSEKKRECFYACCVGHGLSKHKKFAEPWGASTMLCFLIIKFTPATYLAMISSVPGTQLWDECVCSLGNRRVPFPPFLPHQKCILPSARSDALFIFAHLFLVNNCAFFCKQINGYNARNHKHCLLGHRAVRADNS